MALAMIQASASLGDADQKEFLDVHNKARAAVGVPPITWNATLEAYAKAYAAKRAADCALEHSHGPYAENILQGPAEFPAALATKTWVDEKAYYDYKSNSCTGGQECRHYKSVVCKNNKFIGCARIKCRNDGGWFATCNYSPGYGCENPY
ncbi:pathogenesis-related protein 1A-like [Ipomoea triloba]|uniref:pathogenesis-related protein 1A-like n=1 Tax=Ipomoea triloba TaxID=35885 RepID=UPI00125CED56|nr:pathogenesis-related protein 1A-like [Ipomoea triloba]